MNFIALLHIIRTISIFASFGYSYLSAIHGEWARAGFFLLLGLFI